MTETSRPGALKIHRTSDAREVVLALAGELDLQAAPTLAQHLAEVDAIGPQRLVLDLTRVDFMDSSGLRVLISARQSAQDNGYQLVLRQGSRQVQRLLEISGVIDGFTIED